MGLLQCQNHTQDRRYCDKYISYGAMDKTRLAKFHSPVMNMTGLVVLKVRLAKITITDYFLN
jgi:hypothetical protein